MKISYDPKYDVFYLKFTEDKVADGQLSVLLRCPEAKKGLRTKMMNNHVVILWA